MSEPEEIGDAVDDAILEVAHEELAELQARIASLSRVVEALEGEWDDD
jgi:hypothetical protein